MSGSTNSVMQYNYSHDNDGAGYLLAQFPNARRHTNNIVRYNISENDGRKNSYGAIYAFGAINDVEIYNNTIYLTPSAGGSPSAIHFAQDTTNGVRVRNNIFQTTGGLPLVEAAPGQRDLLFQGNNYFSSRAAFQIAWAGTTYDSLAAWRAATGQERIGSQSVGLSVDPQLQAPGSGGTLDDATRLNTLDAYQLKPDSPLIDAGLDLIELFGLSPGQQDFYGGQLPQHATHGVGAYEYAPRPAGATP